MAQLIDRRPNAKGKSTVNRQRFLRRYKTQIKKAISEQISERSITNIDSGESVSIPTRDITEPTFRSDQGGVREGVYPGNKEFAQGDRIKRPVNQGGEKGRRASDSGEGEDDFVFEISRDEYLDLLFDDLALPNLQKNQLRKMTKSKTVRAGFTNDGVPTNINVVRSLRSALSRRVAMGAEPRRRLHELEAELQALEQDAGGDEVRRLELRQEIETLKGRIKRIPFIDTFDLRFNNFVQRPEPTSQAVMFCLMDVSGSMDQETKDIAKRFYILLYLFLTRSYRDVDVVYIRHHTQAKEVDEEEFFYSRETGGTIVSSALELARDIIAQRYPPTDWNIYAAQASDGDNWNDDSPVCEQILAKQLLPQLRYYAYVEITRRDHQGLWAHYENLLKSHDNFAMQHIREHQDIYPVFREFFRKHTQ
ncbi:MAG: YeaH/YhbH family protein [Gammaproteobacteria bacterium]|nr:YeaH/YhbH family protein [Gammaproteobacteria bacterium]MDH3447238.1 YeaH/YhbH family protein [Gammaproteobacteria bacterium]